jgi:hypothetical protein
MIRILAKEPARALGKRVQSLSFIAANEEFPSNSLPAATISQLVVNQTKLDGGVQVISRDGNSQVCFVNIVWILKNFSYIHRFCLSDCWTKIRCSGRQLY